MDRQHQIKRLAGILFIAVLPLLNPAYGADKNTRQTSPDGDEGYFGGGRPGNTNAMILWPRDDHNIVRKFRPSGSAAANPLAFKLWVNPGRSGGFPVNLKNAGAFCSFLQNIGNDPDKGACICEDDPGRPYTGAPLGACAGVNFPACNPVACTPGTPEQPEETEETRRDTWPVCRWTKENWSPSPASTCSDQRVSQRRNVTKITANCVGGTKPASTRTVPGRKRCPTCTPTSWSPTRDTVCAGESLTQSRTLGNCSTDSRTVSGAKSCRPKRKCGLPMRQLGNQCCAQWVNGNSIGCFSLD